MKKIILIGLIGILVLLSAGCAADKTNVYTGFVEDEVESIVPHASGKITELNFQEGEHVSEGDVIALLDDRALQIKRKKLLTQIENQSLTYDLLLDEIDDNALKTLKKQVDNLEEETRLAISSSTLLKQDVVRQEALFDAGALSRSELDQAKLALEASQTKVATLNNQKDQLLIAYNVALEGVDERRLAQIDLTVDQLKQDMEQIDLELENMIIRAPQSGILEMLDVNIDDLCAMGKSIGEVDTESPYVIFYVDNTQLSSLAVGAKVRVMQDGNDIPYDANIYDIASRAQFTPKNVTVKEDRQQLVYRIEASLPRESGFLPGMMVDVVLGE